MMGIAKRGRPPKYEKFTYFGMKITPEEKQQIRTLAHLRGTNAKEAIIGLIQQAVSGITLIEEQELRLKVHELKKLSPDERKRIIQIQVKAVKKAYQDEIIEDYEDIVEN